MRYEEFVPKTFVCLKEKYNWPLIRQDLLAGLTVGIVTLPLAMAFAIASGVTPERGIYTAIIAGFLTALLGGSRVQIGGPTGAFVVVIYGVIQRHGYDGLVMATLIASVMLVVMGLCRAGNMIRYFPPPLIAGFTTGIAVGIFSSQIKDFFGFPIKGLPAAFLDKWRIYFHHLPSINLTNVLVAGSSLAVILLIRRYFRKIPWGIAAIICATLVCIAIGVRVETIGTRFGGIPSQLPTPSFPVFQASRVVSLLPDAIAIAFLAGIESLLCAVVADKMIGGKHRPNCELIAQGIANFGSMVFGGIPATGAVARTATNVHSGAKTPLAGMTHAVVLLLIMLLLSPCVSYIPLAALSAVLMMVAWNVSEVHHFWGFLKSSWKDVAVLLSTFLLTVLVDLVAGIAGGMAVYGLLYIFEKFQKPAPQK